MTDAMSVAFEFQKLDKWSRRKLRQDMMQRLKKFHVPGSARMLVDRRVSAGIRVIKTVQEINHD